MLVRGRWPAPRPAEERPEPRDAAGWARDNGVTLGAVTLIVIQLLWMGTLLARSYFRQDDYFNFDRALSSGLTWKYLMLLSAGHMAPLGFGISWVLARLALYNWPLICIVILALVAAACVALLRVLRTLFGDRPAILIPLAVYLFCPLALAAVDWWSVAVQTLPLELSIFMAVDAHVRYLRGGRMRTAVAAAAWLLLGMATAQKGAVTPLLLFALTSAFFVEGRWIAAASVALRRYWRAWVLYGVLLAGYCALFFSRLPSSTTPATAPGPVGRVISFVSTLVGTTMVPGALGGPWHWAVIGDGYAQASPPAALQQLSWGLALLIVLASCIYRVRAWRAWAIIAGWIAAADVIPVVIGRLGAEQPGLLGLQARYVTDAVSVLALCLGFAFLPLAGDEGGYRFRRRAWPALGDAAVRDGALGDGALGGAKSPGSEGDDDEDAPGDDEPSRDEEPARDERAPDDVVRGRAAPVLRPLTPAARNATLVLLALFLAGSFWSLQALEGITNTQAARSYIATARIAVAKAPRGALIVDGPTPAFIMDPYFFYPTGYTSRVIGAMARDYPAKHLTWTTIAAWSHHPDPDGLRCPGPAAARRAGRGVVRAAARALAWASRGRSHGTSHGRSHGTSRPAAGVARPRCWKLAATGTPIPLRQAAVPLVVDRAAGLLRAGHGADGRLRRESGPGRTAGGHARLLCPTSPPGQAKTVTVTPLSPRAGRSA